MPFVETHIDVDASPEKCYDIASDMEKFPAFMPSVDEITVLEAGETWAKTRWVARLQGKPVKWIEREDFDPENLAISYHQIEGDLKTFEGDWTFTGEDGRCRISLTVDASLGVPMLAAALDPLINKLIRDNANSMLQAIKAEAEGAD